jgi:lipoprotein-releasing system ATP-binding protein
VVAADDVIVPANRVARPGTRTNPAWQVAVAPLFAWPNSINTRTKPPHRQLITFSAITGLAITVSPTTFLTDPHGDCEPNEHMQETGMIRPILELTDLRRVFRQGEKEIHVLAGASASLYPGQAVALVGPSGAGKSTLLHAAGLLETPDSGRIVVNGRDCAKMDDNERTRVRRAEMGFVYQFHQLLPEFTAVENVMMPLLIQGTDREAAEARATELLGFMGLGQRLDHRPARLSGGEQQRTAICRALATKPKLLLAISDRPDCAHGRGCADRDAQHGAGRTDASGSAAGAWFAARTAPTAGAVPAPLKWRAVCYGVVVASAGVWAGASALCAERRHPNVSARKGSSQIIRVS